MSKKNIDHLTQLVSTLSKSEKRNFKLMSKKSGHENALYVQLFDYIERHQKFDQKEILKKIKGIKKTQMANLRSNLYRQVLRSIRDINKAEYKEIKVRELFDFAKVLYAKGMYVQSLNMLQKVKKQAKETHSEPLLFLALSFEKTIESQHVTGSLSGKAKSLEHESNIALDELILRNKLSNLSLRLYGMYLQKGFVRSEDDRLELVEYFKANLPKVNYEKLSYTQKLYFIQSYVWYYNMLQDFPQYYRWSQRWTDLFEEYEEMKYQDTSIYIKAFHNVLNALFMSNKFGRFDEALDKFNNLNSNKKFKLSLNEKTQLEIFRYTHEINRIFLKIDYENGTTKIKDLEEIINSKNNPWDINRTLTFHYKIACVYFGANNLDKTIFHLSKITNKYFPNFKEDLQCFARILKLIAHFDQGDTFLVAYQVKSVFRFLLKMKEMQQAQLEIFKFIRRTPNMLPHKMKIEFKALREKLAPLEFELLERRPFLYLDIISWLDSKIENITMVEAIRKRRKLTY